MSPILNGSRLPAVLLARLENNTIRAVSTEKLFAYGQAVVMGIPGAFTPVCTQRHIPEFVQNAERLTAAGYSHLVCIAPNDPFVLDAWARRVDPLSKIEFYSDGNLEFARSLGLLEQVSHLYLGWRSSRYLMVTSDGMIQRLRVEKDPVEYHCTRPQDIP
jgi:peroxiredoxin